MRRNAHSRILVQRVVRVLEEPLKPGPRSFVRAHLSHFLQTSKCWTSEGCAAHCNTLCWQAGFTNTFQQPRPPPKKEKGKGKKKKKMWQHKSESSGDELPPPKFQEGWGCNPNRRAVEKGFNLPQTQIHVLRQQGEWSCPPC